MSKLQLIYQWLFYSKRVWPDGQEIVRFFSHHSIIGSEGRDILCLTEDEY